MLRRYDVGTAVLEIDTEEELSAEQVAAIIEIIEEEDE